MKMKAVCEQTGLTDRAVRYYIESGLLSPRFTENYLGRKTFDFSEQDIAALKDILVLRSIGYSVAEIHTMQQSPAKIGPLTQALAERTEAEFGKNRAVLDTLARMDISRIHTVAELAEALTRTTSAQEAPAVEDQKSPMQRVLSFCKAAVIALLTWLPILIAGLGIWMIYRHLLYPVFELRVVVILFVLLLPSLLMFFSQKPRWNVKAKRIVRIVLLILCAVSIPQLMIWSIFAVGSSQTNRLFNYRRFDTDCPANFDRSFQLFFPMETMFPDGSQYYYDYEEMIFGTSCDIFAEQVLQDSEFDDEIARVHTLFFENEAVWENTTALTFQNGDYTCYLRYRGQPPIPDTPKYGFPYDIYYLFAYDPGTNTVRYFYFFSEIGDAKNTHYHTLLWQQDTGS